MFWSSFRGVTYNSNHIEGSRLTHDQTRYIFETNTIGFENVSVNVDDVIETSNHFRCIDMVIDQAGNALSEKFIKELHCMCAIPAMQHIKRFSLIVSLNGVLKDGK